MNSNKIVEDTSMLNMQALEDEVDSLRHKLVHRDYFSNKGKFILEAGLMDGTASSIGKF